MTIKIDGTLGFTDIPKLDLDNGVALDDASGDLVLETGDAEKVRVTLDGKVGIGTSTPTQALDITGGLKASGDSSFDSTGAVKVPVGGTNQRPTGADGKIRYNSDLNQYEGYSGSEWSSIGGGAQGAGGDQVFFENDTQVNNSYEITAGKNAISGGPVRINNGAVVTVPSGSRWSIV